MRPCPTRLWMTCTLAATVGLAPAQAPQRATVTIATPDAFAVETGDFVLSVPGVADDFEVFADGQWALDAGGDARLSLYAQRRGALDRDLYLELTFSGQVAPGDANHPPAGAPVLTLAPGAYAPAGPVDPATFVYFTSVTGTATGLRGFAGLRCDISGVGSAQLGVGANNKNVQDGLAVDLLFAVTQPSAADPFTPTGPGTLRGNIEPETELCASHTDPDPDHSATTARRSLSIGGLADDYLLMADVAFVEDDQGAARMTGTVRSQLDREDAWTLDLTFTNRVDPGDANHPPLATPVQDLLPTSYAANGGPVDPDSWRYYTSVTGALYGLDDNDGGQLQLQQALPAHVGVGCTQNNTFFGLTLDLGVTLVNQPTATTIAPTGAASLRSAVAVDCILPAPIVTGGISQTIETVTSDKLVFTGPELGFVEQAAIGPYVLTTNDRNWYSGFVRVIDHQTVEVAIPQGLPAGTYPMRLLNPTRVSNPLTVDLVHCATPTLRTESDRLLGESQHWVTHQGGLQGFAFCFVILSLSDQPSVAPGVLSLDIGANFSDVTLVAVGSQDLTTLTSVVTLPSVPASLIGLHVYAQSGLLGTPAFPMVPSDVVTTDY